MTSDRSRSQSAIPVYLDDESVQDLSEALANVIVTAASGGSPITDTFHLASSAEGQNAQVIYSGSCTVFSADMYNTGPSGVRLGLFNMTSVPTDQDDPKWIIYAAGQDNTEKNWPVGLSFPAGLAISIMSEQAGSLVAGVIESLNIGYRKGV
jgi:hypothetical protein